MKRCLSVLAAVFWISFGALPLVLGDEIILESNGRVKGQIVKETDEYVKILTKYGAVLTYRKDEIREIRREKDIFKQYQEKLRELEYNATAEGYYRLGIWCKERGLRIKAIDAFQVAIQIDGDHRKARYELGYRKWEGKWLPYEEWMEKRGYVLFRGEWVEKKYLPNYMQGLVLVNGKWVSREELQKKAAEEEEEWRLSGTSSASGKKKKGKLTRPSEPWWKKAGPKKRRGYRPVARRYRPPLTSADRRKRAEYIKRQGGWKYWVPSRHYDFFTNIYVDRCKLLGREMDVMFRNFQKLFKYYKPVRAFIVLMYDNQQHFMRATNKGPGVGGFYDGRKIVSFHNRRTHPDQPSTLFHEGTHQFQGMAIPNMFSMQYLKIWMIEGMAVYFEAMKFRRVGKKLKAIYPIPKDRLRHIQMAIRRNSYTPLRELIRMGQPRFGALQYAEAWSLIHYFVNTTKRNRKKFDRYFTLMRDGKGDPVQTFVQIFGDPDKLEQRWKEYVLNLKPKS